MGEKENDENKNADRGNTLETDPAVFHSDFLGKCVSAVVQPGRYKNCRKYAGKKQGTAEDVLCDSNLTWGTDYGGSGGGADDFSASGAESAACTAGTV